MFSHAPVQIFGESSQTARNEYPESNADSPPILISSGRTRAAFRKFLRKSSWTPTDPRTETYTRTLEEVLQSGGTIPVQRPYKMSTYQTQTIRRYQANAGL